MALWLPKREYSWPGNGIDISKKVAGSQQINAFLYVVCPKENPAMDLPDVTDDEINVTVDLSKLELSKIPGVSAYDPSVKKCLAIVLHEHPDFQASLPVIFAKLEEFYKNAENGNYSTYLDQLRQKENTDTIVGAPKKTGISIVTK